MNITTISAASSHVMIFCTVLPANAPPLKYTVNTVNTDSVAASPHQCAAFSWAAAPINSWHPMTHSAATSTAVAQSGAKHSTPISAGTPITATNILCFMVVTSFHAAEPPVPPLIVDNGLIQLLGHSVSQKYSSLYAHCHSRKLESRISPPGRMTSSGSGIPVEYMLAERFSSVQSRPRSAQRCAARSSSARPP